MFKFLLELYFVENHIGNQGFYDGFDFLEDWETAEKLFAEGGIDDFFKEILLEVDELVDKFFFIFIFRLYDVILGNFFGYLVYI